MTRVRSLCRDDLPQVVALYRTHLAVPNVAGEHELRRAFEQVFLGEPLSDPSIPSLVFEGSDGEILGFIGSLVHRMRFEERSVRLACSSSLVVSPKARQFGAGGLLLRKYLTGPQDLTMTDTAGSATEKMWKRLGGSQYHLGSITWLHLLRPVQAAAGLKLWHLGRQQRLPLVRPLCRPLDAAYSRSGTDGTGDAEKLTEEELSPRLLLDHHRLGAQQFDLWPDYDTESLGLLFDQIGRSRSNGRFVKKLVRDERGQPVGWYIASLLPSDIYRVLGLAATRGKEEPLLRHVLRRARDLGAAAVAGRVEPWLLDVFPRRTLMFSRVRFLFHSRDAALGEAVGSGKALLTGLESDIWLPR
jgi:GNAT superfamily N-acetyltransferase